MIACVRARLVGVPAAVSGLERALDVAVARALGLAAKATAASAKAQHKFKNRTGDLERSIGSKPPRGTFSRGTLVAEVEATADHAEHVEAMVTARGAWAYLQPAWTRTARDAEGLVSDALSGAARRAGWRSR